MCPHIGEGVESRETEWYVEAVLPDLFCFKDLANFGTLGAFCRDFVKSS